VFHGYVLDGNGNGCSMEMVVMILFCFEKVTMEILVPWICSRWKWKCMFHGNGCCIPGK
jgi:hypothetical protein